MTQRVGPEDEDRLFAHLDLDRFSHYYATFDTFGGFLLCFVVRHLPLTRNGINLILN